MTSQKESQFLTKDTFTASDRVTGLGGGTNYNFSYTALYNAFSGLGSFNQVGAPLGVPVLEQPAAGVNNVRNLESSKGVIASVSANNGINLACNFKQPLAGSKIIKDLNAAQYEFKSLTAGANISLTELTDSIRINYSPTITTNKTVIISEEADFPTAVLGVITLEADKDYLIVNDITTANRFVTSRPNTIRAASSQMVTLTYSGTGTMFTSVNPSLKLINISVSCPNGSLFDSTAPTLPGIIQMVESNVKACQSLGNIDGNFITRFTNVAFENLVLNGLTFSGANEILVVDVGVAFIRGGSLIDLGTATFNSVSIDSGIIFYLVVGTFLLSGLANSGNLNVGGLGTVINNKGFGTGISLNGISTDDARWNFSSNNSIPDTRPDGLVALTTPTTTILGVATPTKVTGVFSTIRTSQMTATTDGRITYNGEKNATLPITAALSLEPVSGTNKDINIYLAKNGVVIPNSKVFTTVSAVSPKNQSVVWQDSWASGDYYEVWIESVDGTDVQVNTAKLRVN